jgi:hypothetical protein
MRFKVIRTLTNKLARINLDKATEAALKARKEEISELNRDQLRMGKRADDTFLPPYSSNSVTKFGKPKGPIRLFDTGDFYKGVAPDFNKSEFEVKGRDNKTDMLQDRYGDSIIGLSKDSLNELAQDSIGQIQYELRKQL